MDAVLFTRSPGSLHGSGMGRPSTLGCRTDVSGDRYGDNIRARAMRIALLVTLCATPRQRSATSWWVATSTGHYGDDIRSASSWANESGCPEGTLQDVRTRRRRTGSPSCLCSLTLLQMTPRHDLSTAVQLLDYGIAGRCIASDARRHHAQTCQLATEMAALRVTKDGGGENWQQDSTSGRYRRQSCCALGRGTAEQWITSDGGAHPHRWLCLRRCHRSWPNDITDDGGAERPVYDSRSRQCSGRWITSN